MIFSTQHQLKAFYMVAIFSLISLVVVSIFKVIFVYKKSNNILKNIQLFFYTLIVSTFFIIATNLYNYGEFNLGLLVCFLAVGFIFNKISNKLVDFFTIKVYYIYIKIIKWEKHKIAKKLCSIKD